MARHAEKKKGTVNIERGERDRTPVGIWGTFFSHIPLPAIHPMIYLSFAFDHRVLDGEAADNFLVKVKDTLEKWE
jgi:pyruvate/2-oxoglutarate dehydrogenase complex dihydrolipoamide acyltransferase (E2) component